jgi:hypothetical protein
MKLEWLGASSAGIGMHMRYLGVVVLLCACPSSISIVYRRLQEKKNRVHHDEIHDTTVWPKDCFGDIILQFSQL